MAFVKNDYGRRGDNHGFVEVPNGALLAFFFAPYRTNRQHDSDLKVTDSEMKKFSAAFLGLGLSVFAAGQASAAVCQSKSPAGTMAPDYTCLNGTLGAPGTFVGTVGNGAGQVTQIGSLALYNNGGAGAFVNGGQLTSNYEFFWNGGNLNIVGEVGNNGTIDNGIDMELFSYNNGTSAGGTETLIPGASLYFPKTPPPKTPNFNPQILFDGFLASGYYTVSTFAATTDSSAGDPGFQVNFTAGATRAPEPITISLFGAGLAGVAGIRRRRKAAAKA